MNVCIITHIQTNSTHTVYCIHCMCVYIYIYIYIYIYVEYIHSKHFEAVFDPLDDHDDPSLPSLSLVGVHG